MNESAFLNAIIQEYKKYHTLNAQDDRLIREAFAFAQKSHHNQKRASGDPYMTHVASTALQLARWKLDIPSIVSGLLHDVIEDCGISPQIIQRDFGAEILFLIEGVTKLGTLQYQGTQRTIESLRKMMLAITHDLRVLFIKLADRLHNMKTLGHLPQAKQHRIALETTEIYAPLASRLGMQSLAGELEDLAFPYLHPTQYQWIRKNITSSYEERLRYVQRVQHEIESQLHAARIYPIQVDSRAKRISSLYKKLLRNDMDIDRIYDLVALRIMVRTVEECYLVLGIIHHIWKPLPGRIKDYIALPKMNGYQSLHTTVFCIDNRPTEFQIRTQDMHEQAENGAAAHWFYETQKQSRLYQQHKVGVADQKETSIVKQLQEWQKQFPGSQEFVDALKLDVFSDRIFVLTPKGEVIDLPAESTPVDFAYRIHTQVGDSCVGAKVNAKIVHLDYSLQSGDIVEILTQKNKKPSESWMHFVKTRYAMKKIKNAMRKKMAIPQKTEYRIICQNRIGMAKDILAMLSRNHISVINISMTENGHFATIRLVVAITTRERAEQVFLKLRKIEGVKEISFKLIG